MDEQQPGREAQARQGAAVINAVVVKDGQPQLELTASELVFRIETANPSAPIYFHQKPYSFADIKAALKGLKGKIKDAGATIISEEGDSSALLALFDATFLRMSNVVLSATDAEPPSVEQQKAWLDRNPRLKARVINEGFCMVFFLAKPSSEDLTPGVTVDGKPADQPVILEDLLSLDNQVGAKVEFLYRLHSLESGKTEVISLAHQFDVETSRDYNQYDRASRREIEKTSGYTSLDVDHDSLNKLYDRTILSLEGCLVNGESCTEANKKTWAPLVPYYFKKLALDARFEDVTKKNS
jgi:hypothetical protein